MLASFPGPTQLSVAFNTVKRERAWYLFSREWHQDRKGGRKGLIVRGRTGPRTVKRAKVQGSLPHVSGQREAIVLHTERWARSRLKIRETQPVNSANFHNLLITSCSHEKRYQALPALPYWKWWKAGRGLGTRLAACHWYKIIWWTGANMYTENTSLAAKGGAFAPPYLP